MEGVIPPEELALVQKDTAEILNKMNFGGNEFYGAKTRRGYSILGRTRSLDGFFTRKRVTDFLDALFAPNCLLSALQLIEILPGEKAQKLHYDQQFINMGAQTRGDVNLVNAIVAIDDFTVENGATVMVPGSHLWSTDRIPMEHDVKAPLVMKAGTACFFSGEMWHGGGPNLTNKSRRALVIVFQQPWFRPLENHFLAIPFSIAAKLDPRIQSYLGYSVHHPFVGQVDFEHPRKKLLELAGQQSKL
jgi:ectoine hydroxylase-related dioxygenase (phytanoyl-CoA dioxygenase family)